MPKDINGIEAPVSHRRTLKPSDDPDYCSLKDPRHIGDIMPYALSQDEAEPLTFGPPIVFTGNVFEGWVTHDNHVIPATPPPPRKMTAADIGCAWTLTPAPHES